MMHPRLKNSRKKSAQIPSVHMPLHLQDELPDIPHPIRCPMLEMSAYLQEQDGFTSSYPEITDILHDSIAHVANMKGRRIIKTHLPFEFLPPKLVDTCKVLYVCRNPADTAVSYFKYLGNIFRGSYRTYIEMYMKGENCELNLLFGLIFL